jgi:hypothetical protein
MMYGPVTAPYCVAVPGGALKKMALTSWWEIGPK